MTSRPLSSARFSISLFRNDLRLEDNPIVSLPHNTNKNRTKSQPQYWIPLYCFDPKQVDVRWLRGSSNKGQPQFPQTYIGNFPKCAHHRTRYKYSRITTSRNKHIKILNFHRFLVESVLDLRRRLRERGSDLLIAFGRPHLIIDKILRIMTNSQSGSLNGTIYCQKEACQSVDALSVFPT